MNQQGNHTAIVIPAELKEPNETKGWKRVFNKRTAIAILVVVAAGFGAYVQQTNKMHDSFYWDIFLSLALNLIALAASIYIFYDDAKRSNVAWRSPSLQRPWVCYYKIGEEITDIPYIGQPYNIMSILFGLCQSGLALGSFISLQTKGQQFALKFFLPTVVFSLVMLITSFFSNPRGASIIHPPSAQPVQQPLLHRTSLEA